ncbi:Uma2 family endonuclease [Merismopedia glauca]|uniref:Putative restriction endonuclease domain-containing protein n=1 Tax=Merismopedia glauca CCAP 1448/3 TaxID=1296344 RepID=A0A2T1BXM6_9CYAN|nr:Uma2 family endonuclease [Merismopedia glauca]PSB00673.1 hypothetical protein C7B64_22265 [Merismopedia glauca CCAP 1448/3]
MKAIAPPINPTLVLDTDCVKLWTVEEYYRLWELGLIGVNERCELIAGQILLMAAKGTNHVLALRLLASALGTLIDDSVAFISTQDPIHLDDFSEPEPDLAIVRGTILDYGVSHPHPEDILLVVEVADSTLKIDCEVKAQLYAIANIREYWVLDLKNRQLVVFRNPSESGYRDRQSVDATGVVSPVGLGNISLSIAAMLPPEKK